MSALGYQFLCQHFKLSALEPSHPCRIDLVQKVTQTDGALLVPARTAPTRADPIEHALFALKHEGVNLQVLSQALTQISSYDMHNRVRASPTSRYVRVLGFLWEAFNGQQLDDGFVIAGPTVDLFDAKRYITTPGQRNTRWKVNFNGLGSMRYCVTVERTPLVTELLALDILQRTHVFLQKLDQPATDRALSWAFIHETESSFAIEREAPTQDKAQAFVALLKQAHASRRMDQDYLVELQNTAITSPLDRASAFRHQQNWLQGPLRGAAGITYLPPPPEWVDELMEGVLSFANDLPKTIDPLVAAAIASFGFVFVHPFMDGNGRLSRFLFHYALCQSGKLTNGLLLPISVAMKRNEAQYLTALQSFSMQARQQWDVRWIDGEQYDFQFKGKASLYQFWDATPMVEFSLQMAQEALDKDLREATDFLARFDRVYRTIDERFDVRGSDLTTLVISSLQNDGKVSKNRRKQFHLTVQAVVFDAIEEACAQVMHD
jgi:hypothetical protein